MTKNGDERIEQKTVLIWRFDSSTSTSFPTRNTLKIAFLILVVSLAVMLRNTLFLVITVSSEARHSLDELVILDYMANRGFHQMGEVFTREIIVNPNPVAINAPEGFLLEWWNISYEILSSRFPEVVQTVENIVPNINPENLTYALNHMGANISNAMASSPVMPSPHLLSSFGGGYVLPDLSPLTDMTSGLQFPEMSEMGGILPFASNSGYQMQQMPTVPPVWNARDDRPGINLGGPTRMEPNLCLPPWPEPSDAGNNRSLQQASHQGWPSADNVAVQTLDMLKLPAPASSGDFFHMLTQADSSGNMLGDTNQRTPENLPADQQIIDPIVQSGKKRKAPISSVASVRNTVAGFAVPALHALELNGESSLLKRFVTFTQQRASSYVSTLIHKESCWLLLDTTGRFIFGSWEITMLIVEKVILITLQMSVLDQTQRCLQHLP